MGAAASFAARPQVAWPSPLGGDPLDDAVGRVLRGAPPGALAEPLEVRLLVVGFQVQADDRVPHAGDRLSAKRAATRLDPLFAADHFDQQVGVGAAVDERDALL